MNRFITATTCAAMFFGAGAALADHKMSAVDEKVKMMTPPADSKEFAMRAAEGGLLEVKLAQLAQQKASSNDVKQLARTIEQDHSRANDELKTLAAGKKIMLPSDVSGECKDTYDAFSRLDGKVFDNAFVMFQIEHHLHGIMCFRSEARGGTDQDIKQWASKTLPTLEKHAGKIAQVAQGLQIPVEVLAGTGARAGDAVPAGAKIEGSGTNGNRTDIAPSDTPRTPK